MVPGAQLILHSCYLGSTDGNLLMNTLGTAFLGMNGGSAFGPSHPIGSKVLAGEAPAKGVLSTISQTLVIRSTQIAQSLKSLKYIRPGDAFISSNWYFKTTVPAGKLKMPSHCDPSKTGFFSSAPTISKTVQKNGRVEVGDSFIDFSWTNSYGQSHKQRLSFTQPPASLSPGQELKLELSCPAAITLPDGDREGISGGFYTNDDDFLEPGTKTGSKFKGLTDGHVDATHSGVTSAWWGFKLKKTKIEPLSPLTINLVVYGGDNSSVRMEWAYNLK